MNIVKKIVAKRRKDYIRMAYEFEVFARVLEDSIRKLYKQKTLGVRKDLDIMEEDLINLYLEMCKFNKNQSIPVNFSVESMRNSVGDYMARHLVSEANRLYIWSGNNVFMSKSDKCELESLHGLMIEIEEKHCEGVK